MGAYQHEFKIIIVVRDTYDDDVVASEIRKQIQEALDKYYIDHPEYFRIEPYLI